MEQHKHKENEQNQGAQQGNIDMDRDLGNKSQSGATSPNTEKARLQTVEQNNNGQDDKSSPTRTTDMEDKGIHSSNGDTDNNRSGERVSNTSNVDSGYTRTSAFDENREPRSSKEDNRDQRVNASRNDSHAGITRTTNYGPDMPGSWREPDGRRNAPGDHDDTDGSHGRMRD